MWTFIFSFLLLRRLGLSRPIRIVLAVFMVGLIVVVLIYTANLFLPLKKGQVLPMFTRTAPIEAPLSPDQSLLVDRIGNEVYSSHYAERKAYRFIIACGTVVLLGSLGMNLSLARRPIANRYIRIDEMGRAQAIQYSDLNYSPREGEVRTYLTDWANYRYTINRDVIAKKYPLNYYFLSQALASRLMADDNQNHLVSQVTAGQIESSDVAVQNVTITSMSEEMVQGSRIARGTALMTVDRLYSAQSSREPRTEHWMLSITYYLNPKQVSDQSRIYPQYEFINPLGLTITEFHENRVSVDPLKPDATTGPAR
jgi:type IV secretion system protein VirB5